jgi:hypothetical protein
MCPVSCDAVPGLDSRSPSYSTPLVDIAEKIKGNISSPITHYDQCTRTILTEMPGCLRISQSPVRRLDYRIILLSIEDRSRRATEV